MPTAPTWNAEASGRWAFTISTTELQMKNQSEADQPKPFSKPGEEKIRGRVSKLHLEKSDLKISGSVELTRRPDPELIPGVEVVIQDD